MELFLAFIFLSTIVSLALRKQRQSTVVVAMLVASACVLFGYFFLNQI